MAVRENFQGKLYPTAIEKIRELKGPVLERFGPGTKVSDSELIRATYQVVLRHPEIMREISTVLVRSRMKEIA
jgi:hypothetical protein